MILRPEQLRALGALRQKTFEGRLYSHVLKHFPERTLGRDQEELRNLLRKGTARARGHGFRTEQDLCKYLNLVFVFGLDFDHADDLPWARRILENQDIGPTLRINRLYLEALKHEPRGKEPRA